VESLLGFPCHLGKKGDLYGVSGDDVDGGKPFMMAAGIGTISFNFPGLFEVDDRLSVLSADQ